MNTKLFRRGTWMMAVIFSFSFAALAIPGAEDASADTVNYTAYFGKVIDSDTRRTLPFATVEAQGSNVATVTNIDGEFIIKISTGTDVSGFKISYIGYSSQVIPVSEFDGDRTLTIQLEPSVIALKEITVRPQYASELIAAVLQNMQ